MRTPGDALYGRWGVGGENATAAKTKEKALSKFSAHELDSKCCTAQAALEPRNLRQWGPVGHPWPPPLAPAACSAACSAAPGVTPRLPSCRRPRGGPGTASRLLSRNEEALHLPRRRGQRTAPAVKLEAGGTPPHGAKTANNATRHGG